MMIDKMVVLILFVLIEICCSAPIDTCSLAGTTINDKTWAAFVKKIVNCIEHAVSIDDQDRYNFLMSLASELSEISYKNDEQNIHDNILPFNIPKGLHNQMTEIVNRRIIKENEIMQDGRHLVSVVDIFQVGSRGEPNALILVILSGLLAFSALTASIEIYVSWKKYSSGKRVQKIVRRPKLYTLKQSLNGQGDVICK